MDLFEDAQAAHPSSAPLAERLRPQSLDEVVGQEHLLGAGKSLRRAIETDQVPSLIFWGPPGVGKTTIARLIAAHTGADFKAYSAVTAGIKELKEVIAQARESLRYHRRRTILFIDEIHRFNKAQQDAFLPFVENGTIILIGATTENPSFEVNAALLSRCQVYVLEVLTVDDLLRILHHAVQDPELGLEAVETDAQEKALRHIAEGAHGDARVALNALEMAALLAHEKNARTLTPELSAEALQRKLLRYDRAGEEHYNLISALHKSVRGSDPDAALYWLGRMLEAGEDPRYLLRRMARMAAEDVGLADPQALVMAAAAEQCFDFIGLPEGKLALAELAVYLALAPKSNALETGYHAVMAEVEKSGELPVPLHIRNAPTDLMRKFGYGRDYRYAHDYPGNWVADDYLPEKLVGRRFYRPGTSGWEQARSAQLEARLRERESLRPAPGRRPDQEKK